LRTRHVRFGVFDSVSCPIADPGTDRFANRFAVAFANRFANRFAVAFANRFAVAFADRFTQPKSISGGRFAPTRMR
jgi:hypothetical protein